MKLYKTSEYEDMESSYIEELYLDTSSDDDEEYELSERVLEALHDLEDAVFHLKEAVGDWF